MENVVVTLGKEVLANSIWVSDSNSYGVVLRGAGIDCNWVAGNYIGTDASGKVALGNHQFGIWVYDSAGHNAIQDNLVCGNEQVGIQIENARDNIIFHNNLVDNRHNSLDYFGTNRWDCDEQGNYWSDYTDKDKNGDGIGDTRYPVPPSGVDNYPLMKPHSQ